MSNLSDQFTNDLFHLSLEEFKKQYPYMVYHEHDFHIYHATDGFFTFAMSIVDTLHSWIQRQSLTRDDTYKYMYITQSIDSIKTLPKNCGFTDEDEKHWVAHRAVLAERKLFYAFKYHYRNLDDYLKNTSSKTAIFDLVTSFLGKKEPFEAIRFPNPTVKTSFIYTYHAGWNAKKTYATMYEPLFTTSVTHAVALEYLAHVRQGGGVLARYHDFFTQLSMEYWLFKEPICIRKNEKYEVFCSIVDIMDYIRDYDTTLPSFPNLDKVKSQTGMTHKYGGFEKNSLTLPVDIENEIFKSVRHLQQLEKTIFGE